MNKFIEGIKIIETKQINENYDPQKANNGGGYKHTETTFILANGDRGVYRDTSCGDFGTRYTLEIEGKPCAMWGSMIEEHGLDYALFNGQEPLYPALNKAFNVPCEPGTI